MRRRSRKCDGAVMKKAAAEARKRKIRLEELEVDASSVQFKTPRLSPENLASPTTNSENSTCVSVNSDHVEAASCCSSDGWSGLAKRSSKFVDLEARNETETIPEFSATSAAGDSSDCRKRRETTPSSEVQAESGELESTAGPCESKSYHHKDEIPSEAELEEFFSIAEKNLQKQFIKKYNYDIVKDQPLEGRYEWVPI